MLLHYLKNEGQAAFSAEIDTVRQRQLYYYKSEHCTDLDQHCS